MADLGGKEAIQGFIRRHLVPTVVSIDPPKAINVLAQFATYLVNEGTPQIVAEERAEEWRRLLIDRITRELVHWEKVGTSRPAWFAEDGQTLLTWSHPRFVERTGFPSANLLYFEALEWIRALNGKAFLIPCAVFLRSMGADPIYITDGPGDEGIDLIGMVNGGALHSTTVFVQAKSGGGPMSRDAMLLEYGKYKHLFRTTKYNEYRRALPENPSGRSFVYAIAARAGFLHAAQEIGARLGILLRSDIQLAQYVEDRYQTISTVHDMAERMSRHLQADLTHNVLRYL